MKRDKKLDEETDPKVAFYTRISTDEVHQKYSLGAQKERLEAFCKSQYGDDWSLFKIYRDTESGTHMNRPGLEKMLSDAEAGAFNTLLVFRVDRLSRKVRELAQMVDELTQHKVTLKSSTEPFDTGSIAGKMMLQMLGVFAEFEHGTIVERTKVGMERKAKSGKFVGGNIPYGYQLVPEKGLVVNEDEAVLVRKMFRDYVVGRDGVSRITNKLNQAGYRKRSGKVWDKRMVLHMLRNPTYIGRVRWKTVYEGEHQPIVPEDLFRNVEKILKERSEEMKGRQFHNGNSRLLTGIIRCAKCKSPMYGSAGTRKDGTAIPYYVCRKRQVQHACKQDYIRADRLEESLVRDVKSMFQDDKLLDQIWKETNKRLEAEKPDVDKQIKKVEVEIARIRKRIERYFDAFEAGALQPEVCNEKVQDLNSQVGELEAEKRKLEACRESLGLPVLDKEHLAELLENFDQVLEAGTGEQKKHLFRKLVKKVLIHEKRKIEVWYRLPNPPNIRTLVQVAPRVGLEPTKWQTLTG